MPAERAIWPPLPILVSTLWTMVPIGMLAERHRVAGLDVDLVAGNDGIADGQALRRQDVGELAVRILDEGDERRPVRIVLEPLDRRRLVEAARLKSTSR